MGPIFEANEKFKEILCLKYGAIRCKTKFHKDGTYLISEPFLESEAVWDKAPAGNELVTLAMGCADLLAEVSDLGGQMVTPFWEVKHKKPMLVWAQFLTKPRDEHENNC